MQLLCLFALLCVVHAQLVVTDSASGLVEFSENGRNLTLGDYDTLNSEEKLIAQAGLSGMFVAGGRGLR